MVLQEGVSHIPDKLAYGCTALEQVALPDSLVSTGVNAWEKPPFLENWVREGQKGEIFWDGRNLQGEARLSADVRILAGGAFYGNQKLVIIRLPESVRWIGPMAFDACCRLRRVYWHSPVDRLEEAVFAGCPELETVENPMGGPVAWKSIGARAFFNCRSLREVCLKQVEEIGNTAFYGCGGLRRDRDGIGFSHSVRRLREVDFEGTCLLGAVGREGEGASEGTSLPVVYGNIVVSGAGCGGVPTEWR